ncbi:MAG TPA: type II toxin-antitoxin system YafQ family toxin [Candidatus Paceibacterota bacterium]|nr:type II toxin-antitoxin system YafQ family toxin [Candidatus Paceibacterota bacterium]
MYLVVLSSRARKSLRRYSHSGSFPKGKFRQALMHLREHGSLPVNYRDHQLHGELSIFREFHLADDLLVQYKRNEELRIITLADIGTHSELFGS